jgi:hypothetical protein
MSSIGVGRDNFAEWVAEFFVAKQEQVNLLRMKRASHISDTILNLYSAIEEPAALHTAAQDGVRGVCYSNSQAADLQRADPPIFFSPIAALDATCAL